MYFQRNTETNIKHEMEEAAVSRVDNNIIRHYRELIKKTETDSCSYLQEDSTNSPSRENINEEISIVSSIEAPNFNHNIKEFLKIDPVIAIAYSTILGDCLDMLVILRQILDENIDVDWQKLYEYKSPEERRMQKDTLKSKVQRYERNNYTNSEKRARDLTNIIAFLECAYIELIMENTFSIFFSSLAAYWQEEYENEIVVLQKSYNENILPQIKAKFVANKEQAKAQIKEYNTIIGLLNKEVEELTAYSFAQKKYNDQWENSRHDQNILKTQQEENNLFDKIQKTFNDIDNEKRINSEIERFIETTKQEYLDEIEYWVREYDDQIEQKENEILILKGEWEKLTEHHINLAKEYTRRSKEIEAWDKHKEKLRKAEERRKLVLWATIKIQSWWRGTMVRKCIGKAYKKLPTCKKKKGRKGKKKKK